MLSGADLVRPLIIVVVLCFSIVLTASDGKLLEDLGDFGAKHTDEDDSKSGLTSMIIGSQNRPVGFRTGTGIPAVFPKWVTRVRVR